MKIAICGVAALLITGCSGNSNDVVPGGIQRSTTELYTPLLDSTPPELCESNCRWPLKGSEWRLISYSDNDEQSIPSTDEALFTLLFSEVDNNVAGLFACNELTGSYGSFQSAVDQFSPDMAMMQNGSISDNDCELSGSVATEYRFVAEFLTAGELTVRTGGSLLYVENALGQSLTYRGRFDALDGEYRTFETVASGDYLPLADNAPENSQVDVSDSSTDILIYESVEDFRSTSPELASVVDATDFQLNLDEKTLLGLFLGQLSYLGPDIRVEHVIERDSEVEVQISSGLFWCDDGFGQPRGDNAPYKLTALKVHGKPITFEQIASSACP